MLDIGKCASIIDFFMEMVAAAAEAGEMWMWSTDEALLRQHGGGSLVASGFSCHSGKLLFFQLFLIHVVCLSVV